MPFAHRMGEGVRRTDEGNKQGGGEGRQEKPIDHGLRGFQLSAFSVSEFAFQRPVRLGLSAFAFLATNAHGFN